MFSEVPRGVMRLSAWLNIFIRDLNQTIFSSYSSLQQAQLRAGSHSLAGAAQKSGDPQ